MTVVVPHPVPLWEPVSTTFSREHLRFFTTVEALEYVEAALEPNSYRGKSPEDGDGVLITKSDQDILSGSMKSRS